MKTAGRPRTKYAPAEECTRWGKFQWPPELCRIAHCRTKHLFGWLRFSSVEKVIESAYLQGVTDGIDAALAIPRSEAQL